MPFPKLIFGEDHADLITIRILSAIAPKLKEQGYSVFLDEMPTELTLHVLRKNLDRCSQWYSAEKKKNPNFYNIRQEIGLALNNFLKILVKQKIVWQAIDPLQDTDSLTEEQYVALQPIRDSEMAKVYMNEDYAFGRMGLNHIPGLREYLVDYLGEEKVTQDFRFFHIHSLGEEIKDQLPNDLIIIDAANLSQEEIIGQIMKTIESAKEQSSDFSLRR